MIPSREIDHGSGPPEQRNDRVCADFIKSLHADLRLEAQNNIDDSEQIWDNHVKDGSLAEYSSAMHQLATQHWKTSEGSSRISWVTDQVKKFFFRGDRKKWKTKIESFKTGHGQPESNQPSCDAEPVENSNNYHLLDVGSCYNPFAEEFREDSRIKVTAIDLQPSQDTLDTVMKCDFYRVPVGDCFQVSGNEVTSLKRGAFDVVVFCLLLEYLPLPKMRHRVCLKARDSLSDWGLLLIVTPDSSHQGKNETQMKAWRLALINMGLIRICTEKLPHARCLGFIKVPTTQYKSSPYMVHEMEKARNRLAQNGFQSHESDEDLMFIPQDETTRQKIENESHKISEATETYKSVENYQESCVGFLNEFASL